MKGLSADERRMLSILADAGDDCAGYCDEGDDFPACELAIIDSLEARGLLRQFRCDNPDAVHTGLTALGRLALRIDTAIRATVAA